MHDISFPAMFEESINKGSIKIGHDVWVGANSCIMGGVTIGTGAIIGASAVVTKDVPPYSVAAGVPAREIRKRFADATIEKLLASSWWEWPLEEIQARKHELAKLTSE
ncbi:MAG: CatB-related O-acetyltransferase [Mariprofundaceae bacterium]